MSLAIAHFAVGAMATALLLTLVAPRLLHSPTALVVGGLWGMLPDVHWVLPAGSGAVRSFHMSSWSNVFWFHNYVDGVDPGNSKKFAAGLVVALLFVVAFCELVVRVRRRSITLLPTGSRQE